MLNIFYSHLFSTDAINLPSDEATPIIKLWVLRIFIKLRAHHGFIRKDDFENEATASFLGLDKWLNQPDDFSDKGVKHDLLKAYKTSEISASDTKAPKQLRKNINKLSKELGLSKTDCRILEFIVLLKIEVILNQSTNLLGTLSTSDISKVIAVILSLPVSKVQFSLRAKGALQESGLLSIEMGKYSLTGKLELISDDFSDSIYSSKATEPMELLQKVLFKSLKPELNINDFKHMNKELDILSPYLSYALKNNRKAVNFYIHGQPGTGKTQLVRVLAKELGYELFEISSRDEDDKPIDGFSRLKAYQVAQSVLKNKKAIILFDEVEDIFSDGLFKSGVAQKHKAWMNRMLEKNIVPCFWLSNSYQGLDAAFIRRYDMIFELPVPPKSQREKIIKQKCSGFLPSQVINRISEAENLSPAVVSKAASVIESIKNNLGSKQTIDAFELLINNTLETQGHKPIKNNNPNHLPRIYDPRCINADTNIDGLAAGLKQTKSGRICIYGPPGTGKTAYGRWLAEQLEMPLMVKRGSDIISKWVGDTEKNIAKVFKVAEADGALLLIDEIEGFLQDRRNTQNNWETSAVNEMLTQMESYSGVFMASTNLIDTLDQAALRRFDLKLKFDFLLPDQSWRLLKSYCKALKLPTPNSKTKHGLDHLQNITPGDFAAIMRRHRFKPLKSPMKSLLF